MRVFSVEPVAAVIDSKERLFSSSTAACDDGECDQCRQWVSELVIYTDPDTGEQYDFCVPCSRRQRRIDLHAAREELASYGEYDYDD